MTSGSNPPCGELRPLAFTSIDTIRRARVGPLRLETLGGGLQAAAVRVEPVGQIVTHQDEPLRIGSAKACGTA